MELAACKTLGMPSKQEQLLHMLLLSCMRREDSLPALGAPVAA